MSLVSFVKAEKESQIKKGIEDALDLIQYRLPSDVKNIVIKPNMCYYWDWTTGQTTDPRFVATLIEVLRKKIGSHTNISIVESDASAMKCKHAFKMLGYERMAQEYNVKLVNLSEDKSDPIEVRVKGQSFHLAVPQTIQKAELKINVPKIKYMAASDTKITCALKNIYGCNPYPKKFRYHSRLTEVIVAINKTMKFDLCIADGIIVSGIEPRRLGLVMASNDPVAFDVAAAKIAGENPRTIRYIQLAREEGLGNTTFISKGEPLKYFEARYPRKSIGIKLRGKAYRLAVRTGLSKRLGLE
jgi:uncharacterized protein (DUF362 family)